MQQQALAIFPTPDIELIQGDCLEVMPTFPDKSIDMILCDLPYGTTACKWDTVIPFEPLWKEYKRLIKDMGAIVLFGSQPFTSALVMSNPKMFKYELIWQKCLPTNPLLANKMPLKYHENLLIFYDKPPIYNPQLDEKIDRNRRLNKIGTLYPNSGVFGETRMRTGDGNQNSTLPKSIMLFPRECGIHPTQKPVALCEYLIKTYTNEGDTVLDNCMGSGTTGVACRNLNRNFIGIEKEPEYFEIASKRIDISV